MKFLPYPTYENSGVGWLGEVPSDWRLQKLRRIFEIKKRIAGEIGYDIFSITQNGFKVKDIESNEGQLSQDYSKYQFVFPGDFAMNPMDLITGGADLAKSTGVTSPDYRVFSLRKPSDYSDRFLLYLFRHLYRNELFFQYGQGSSQLGRWRLPRQAFNDFVFPVPDKSTQEAIAKFLDTGTAKIDELITKQERLIELSQEKRQALISHTVTKGLNPNAPMKDSGIEWLGTIPARWTVKKLKHLSSRISSGKTPLGGSEVYVNEGITFLRSQNVYDEGLRLDEVVFITAAVDKAMAVSRVIPNDILLNITGASIGRSCVVPIGFLSANVNQHVCAIRLKKRSQVSFVGWFFKSATIKDQIDHVQNGAAREGMNFVQIGEMYVCLPPDDEQERIGQYLEGETTKIDLLIEKAKQAIELMKEHRTALISAAVTGKIDVRGTN